MAASSLLAGGKDSNEETTKVRDFGARALFAGPESVHENPREGQRSRKNDTAEKEYNRLKRLLRNRVSAQQAREKKKAYLHELEERMKYLETKNSELQDRVSTLQKENLMLRHILKSTTSNSR